MKYDIKVTKLNNDEWSTKAFVALTFEDSLKITEITIREAKNGNLFIAMPGYKTSKTDDKGNPVYKNYCYPVTAEFRKELYDSIIEVYKSEANEKSFVAGGTGANGMKQTAGAAGANSDVDVKTENGSNDLNYTVSLYPFNHNDKVESIGRISVDDKFVIDGIRIFAGNNGSFVSMPTRSKTGSDGKTEYQDICYPVTKEFREALYGRILEENQKLKEQSSQDFVQVSKEIEELAQTDNLPFR